jgi:hypothetical protein
MAQSPPPSIGEEHVLPACAAVIADAISDIPEPQLGIIEQIPEPAAKSRNVGRLEIPEPQLGAIEQIPEPIAKSMNMGRLEIPELEIAEPSRQIPEPLSVRGGDLPLGEEINADLLLDEVRRLWNLETYRDRYGKNRLRRALRFIRPPVREELGVVAETHAAALQGRRGRGRWKRSREEARALRPLVDSVAESYWRNKRGRRRGQIVSKRKRSIRKTARHERLPKASDSA